MRTGLEEWSMLEREMVLPSVVISGSVKVEKAMDPFGEVQEGWMEVLRKGSHPLLGKRVRHLMSGKTGLVKFASHARGRVIAVEYDDESRVMTAAEELELI